MNRRLFLSSLIPSCAALPLVTTPEKRTPPVARTAAWECECGYYLEPMGTWSETQREEWLLCRNSACRHFEKPLKHPSIELEYGKNVRKF